MIKETGSSFTSVPAHNYLIFFEIFKNALRATVEHHGENCANLPPVNVKVTRESEMLVVDVEDQGGGMDVAQAEKASKFFSSTAELDQMSLYQGGAQQSSRRARFWTRDCTALLQLLGRQSSCEE